MITGAALETVSIGLVLPILSSITNPSMSSYLQNLLEMLNIKILFEDTFSLIIYAVIFFFLVYLFNNIFLSFLFWRQSKFIYSLMDQLVKII